MDGKIALIVIGVLAVLIIANIGFIVIAAKNDKIGGSNDGDAY